MIIAFAGHRDIRSSAVSAQLRDILRLLENRESELCFYTGGMGSFDMLAATVVHNYRILHPKSHIRLSLVLPYMTNRINTEKEYNEILFDEIILPLDADNAHYKSAITLRNRWMVDHADCIIAYVEHNSGGAYTTLRYAQKHNKPILNLADPDVNQIFTCIFPLKPL